MWKFFQTDTAGDLLNVEPGLKDKKTLMVESQRVLAAHWKSPAITTATTTTVVEARPSQSILLTDLVVILSKKVASATIVVRFSDGTNTVNLLTFDAATASFEFRHAFTGGLRGWKDADLQIVTNQATTISPLVGYVHLSSGTTQTYPIWNSER